MAGPLAGLRVLDFSRLVPGPHCTALLYEMGAEILKIEDVQTGDLTRSMPPLVDGIGALFSLFNTGKQSVALDLKDPAGQAIVCELVERSDVVVEGFRPGVAERLRIDFGTLSGVQPRLVYCSLSGFGQNGPERDLPGHDLTYAAMTGLLDALSPGEPRVPGVQLVDSAAALLAATRILAALRAADHGPQYLDISLADAARQLMPVALGTTGLGLATNATVGMLRGSPRYDLYRCSDDEWIAVTPLEDAFWERLVAVLRADGLLGPNESATSAALQRVFSTRPASDWFAALSAANIPAAPVRTLMEAAADLPRPKLRPPLLGEHTRPWLTTLGYDAVQIDNLIRRGAVRGPYPSGSSGSSS